MTTGGDAAETRPRLRADARRNQEQILQAARDVFFEDGTAAPLDEIARRANVGIATLYRRFPDRTSLFRQLAVDGFEVVLAQARAARSVAERPDADAPLLGIERFLLGMVEQRLRFVLPLYGGPVIDDEEAASLRQAITSELDALLALGRERHAVRADVTSTDLIMAAAMISRPLPNTPPDWVDTIARRHVAVHLDGMRPGGVHRLPDLAFTREDLERQIHRREVPVPGAAPGGQG
ncbi:TetR/AcrR family transcriptional regulator [Kitasatospora sp. NPDC087314]|uniref:TetR/AcrR family transcriptional regulator n=1 Tax=Kitasatospora sp. NPDC087314 TaxID=3364068 RepID=UPI0037FA19C2